MMNDKPKTSTAQLEAVKKYRKAKVNRMTIDFYPTEEDLYNHLMTKPNKQGYIKGLIRADMERDK